MKKSLIAEASKGLKLGDIYLYESNIKRFDTFDRDSALDTLKVRHKLAAEAQEYQSTELKTDEESGRKGNLLEVKVHFGVRYIDEKDEHSEPKILAQIEATFLADYVYEEDVSEDAVNEFIKFNVVHNAWPFWREFVFQMAERSHLPKPEIALMFGKSIGKASSNVVVSK